MNDNEEFQDSESEEEILISTITHNGKSLTPELEDLFLHRYQTPIIMMYEEIRDYLIQTEGYSFITLENFIEFCKNSSNLEEEIIENFEE